MVKATVSPRWQAARPSDRIAPARRDIPISFELPKIECLADAVAAHTAVLAAVANGEITPGGSLDENLVDGFVKTIELAEIDERLKRLEGEPGYERRE